MLEPFHATQLFFIGVGAVTLGISMTISFWKTMKILTRDIEKETPEMIIERDDEASHIQYAGFVNGIGFITYLMLLAGYGRILTNGEEFIYIQYIEWIISTPIIVMNTARVLAASSSMIVSVIIYDLLMIIAGFCASVSSTVFWRYLFFTISSLYWVAIFRILFFQHNFISKKLIEYPDVVLLFDRLIKITIFSWSIYPILFLLGPNGSIVSGSTGFLEVAVCLDVMAKGVWGFIQTINSRALKEAMDKYESGQTESSHNNMMLSCLVTMGCIEQDIVEIMKHPPQEKAVLSPELLQQFMLFHQQQQQQQQQQPNQQQQQPNQQQQQPNQQQQQPNQQQQLTQLIQQQEHQQREQQNKQQEQKQDQDHQEVKIDFSTAHTQHTNFVKVPTSLHDSVSQNYTVAEIPPFQPVYKKETIPYVPSLPQIPSFVHNNRKNISVPVAIPNTLQNVIPQQPTSTPRSTPLSTPHSSPRQVLRSLGSGFAI